MAYNRIWLYGFCVLILAGVASSSQDHEDHCMSLDRWLPGRSVPGDLTGVVLIIKLFS